jgi:nucleoside-diphosphate kinase
MERTLVLLKPDCVDRRLVGEVISRFERKGLLISAIKMLRLDRTRAAQHYASLRNRPFYEDLINYITCGPLVALVITGPGVIDVVRKLVGVTDAAEAVPGTIRGDLSLCITFNVVHASDSPQSAEREVALFFGTEEICDEGASSVRGHWCTRS